MLFVHLLKINNNRYECFKNERGNADDIPAVSAQFSLPPLEYSYNALEPYIDAMTMEIHYTKHHQGYVNNLNKAVEGTRLAEMPLDEMLINAEARGTAIRNNGGGHYNHSLFWSIFVPEPDKTP